MQMLKRLTALVLAVMTLMTLTAFAQEDSGLVERNPLIDSAFTMLEEGNIFLEKYNQITGADLEVHFKEGLPYFWGGMHNFVFNGGPLLFSRKPEFARKTDFSNGFKYLYGLDCSGYIRWVFSEVGWPTLDSLTSIALEYNVYGKDHLYSQRPGMEMPPYEQLARELRVGDLLIGKIGTRHVMMFIGTLREFGFTAETAPELADYLDYPLVVHCGRNPDYAGRIKKYLEDRADDPYYADVHLPIGGVCVSIIGPRPKDAPHEVYSDMHTYYYFDLNGYRLTLWDIKAATSFCWYRIPLDEE